MEIKPQGNVVGNGPNASRALSLFVREAGSDGPRLSDSELVELNDYDAAHPVSSFLLFFAGAFTAFGKDIRTTARDASSSIRKHIGLGII